jgi:hypothetical protein
MKSTRKITTAARCHEIFVVRRRQRFELFCEQCDTGAQFVAIDDAVLFSGFATREIVRLVEDDELHFLETSGGHLFICQKSLAAKQPAKCTADEAIRTV